MSQGLAFLIWLLCVGISAILLGYFIKKTLEPVKKEGFAVDAIAPQAAIYLTVQLNLTGYTFASQIRKSYGSSTYYTFTASVYDAATGKVRLQLTSTQTSAIPAGRYLYDIEITNTSTTAKTRILEGIVIVTPEITQT